MITDVYISIFDLTRTSQLKALRNGNICAVPTLNQHELPRSKSEGSCAAIKVNLFYNHENLCVVQSYNRIW